MVLLYNVFLNVALGDMKRRKVVHTNRLPENEIQFLEETIGDIMRKKGIDVDPNNTIPFNVNYWIVSKFGTSSCYYNFGLNTYDKNLETEKIQDIIDYIQNFYDKFQINHL